MPLHNKRKVNNFTHPNPPVLIRLWLHGRVGNLPHFPSLCNALGDTVHPDFNVGNTATAILRNYVFQHTPSSHKGSHTQIC